MNERPPAGRHDRPVVRVARVSYDTKDLKDKKHMKKSPEFFGLFLESVVFMCFADFKSFMS